MKFKLATLATSLTFLGMVLAPANGFALTSANLYQSGTTSQTNGNFAVTISENGDDTVNYADAELSFSAPVSNVHVTVTGPFSAQPYPCSAAYCAIGGVTGDGAAAGLHTLATVSFTLDNPGSVSLSFDGSSSLKHTNRDVNGFAISTTSVAAHGSSALYTYAAPAPAVPSAPAAASSNNSSSAAGTKAAATGGGTKAVASSNAATAPASDNTATPVVAGASTEKDAKHIAAAQTVKTHHTGLVTSSLSVVLIAAVAAYWLVMRKRPEAVPAKAYKLNAATAASKSKPAKKKPATKATATRSKSAAAARKPKAVARKATQKKA